MSGLYKGLYFVMLQKIWWKNFQNCTYWDDGVTNYVNSFEKIFEVFFSEINLVAVKKKIFKIFFQLLKLKITYKFNIYRG